MKVICIDDKDRDNEWPSGDTIKEGKIYSVIRTAKGYGVDGESNGMCHELAEFPGDAYQVSRFIPLSNVDEKTFERDYNKQLA